MKWERVAQIVGDLQTRLLELDDDTNIEIAFVKSETVGGVSYPPAEPPQPPIPTSLSLEEMVKESYGTALEKGWWEGDEKPNIPEKIALMHSELSEALEEYRNATPPIYTGTNGKPEGLAIELADVLIRIGDFCGKFGIDLNHAVLLKMQYNRTRPHRHGGKVC